MSSIFTLTTTNKAAHLLTCRLLFGSKAAGYYLPNDVGGISAVIMIVKTTSDFSLANGITAV